MDCSLPPSTFLHTHFNYILNFVKRQHRRLNARRALYVAGEQQTTQIAPIRTRLLTGRNLSKWSLGAVKPFIWQITRCKKLHYILQNFHLTIMEQGKKIHFDEKKSDRNLFKVNQVCLDSRSLACLYKKYNQFLIFLKTFQKFVCFVTLRNEEESFFFISSLVKKVK